MDMTSRYIPDPETRHGPASHGFSLVEIMVAMVVLSVGIFSAASMLIHADHTCAAAFQSTAGMDLAHAKMETLMSLEYSTEYMDPELMADHDLGGAEPFADANGNGLWDLCEEFADLNNNGTYDPAHSEPVLLDGHRILWSIVDASPLNGEILYIRVYVIGRAEKDISILTCIKSRK